MEYDVFLSYSHEDTDSMQVNYQALQAAGLRVWFDQEGLRIGSYSWKQDLEEALRASRCVVVLASPEANASQYVEEEIAFARNNGIQIFFALVRGDELPYGYRNAQRADVRRGDEKKERPKLIASIQDFLSGQITQPDLAESVTAEVSIPRRQPLSVKNIRLVMNILQAAADLMPDEPQEGRAALLWVDKKQQELYIVAATEQFKDEHLRFRFKKGQGFAGEVWAKGDRQPVTDYPQQMSIDDLRQRWGFNDEQIRITHELGVIVSLPIFDGTGEMIGILSIDSFQEISPEQLQESGIYQDSQEMRNLIAQILTNSRPFAHRGYVSLRNILEVTRLIPPLPVPVRAGFFWVDQDDDKDDLYVFAGSDVFERLWLESDERFQINQGLVGRVWYEKRRIVDRRPADETERIKFLREERKMTDTQIEIARKTQSIVGIPVMNRQNNEVIAVLIVNSTFPMSESQLDKGENLILLDELAKLAERVIERELNDDINSTD